MDPCSACIFAAEGAPPVDPSLEVVLVTDRVRCPFLDAFTDNVGEGDCTLRLFL